MLLWEILSVSEQYLNNIKHEWVCESRSVVSDSLWPHGLYSPWNSPGQNTGVGSLSLLQEFFPMQGSNPGLPHCRRILYQLSHREAQEYWSGYPIPSPVDLPTQELNWGLLHCRQCGVSSLSNSSLFQLIFLMIYAAAAAAAKSLQSCPTLCDPIDSSPPGSPVPGILQARTLEWAAISFSNA